MADIFTVTAPVQIRHRNGTKKALAHIMPHPLGLVCFEFYWHESKQSEGIYLIKGNVKGAGPWKIGDYVISVIGCHGTDPELALEYEDWIHYLTSLGDTYPDSEARKAIVADKYPS